MVQVGLKEAKNKLSELFTKALHGETVVITRQGETRSIRLTPVPVPQTAKGFGMLREQLADLPPDWNSPEAEAEFLRQFEAHGSDAGHRSSKGDQLADCPNHQQSL